MIYKYCAIYCGNGNMELVIFMIVHSIDDD